MHAHKHLNVKQLHLLLYLLRESKIITKIFKRLPLLLGYAFNIEFQSSCANFPWNVIFNLEACIVHSLCKIYLL